MSPRARNFFVATVLGCHPDGPSRRDVKKRSRRFFVAYRLCRSGGADMYPVIGGMHNCDGHGLRQRIQRVVQIIEREIPADAQIGDSGIEPDDAGGVIT
ncbi:hypothetical protein PEC730217_00940 [Pectobacterium carotovorum subsp. carotovorum]|nr:hypothetical protein PEC730217_00940 [Pectobacterium carotovorum subsp. carotovorum]